MALKLTSGNIHQLKKKLESMHEKGKRLAAKTEAATGHVVRTLEVGGTAFGLGLVNGRFAADGGIEILGVPLDLAVGSGLHILGFVGGNRYEDHLHAMGDGALAAYLSALGTGVGARMRRGGDGESVPRNVESLPGAVSSPISTEAIADMAREAVQR